MVHLDINYGVLLNLIHVYNSPWADVQQGNNVRYQHPSQYQTGKERVIHNTQPGHIYNDHKY